MALEGSLISEGTRACYDSFNQLLSTLKASDHGDMQNQTEDEFEQLRYWAKNVGAGSSGHSSLDYRLRDDIIAQELTLSVLRSLKSSLEACVELCTFTASTSDSQDSGVSAALEEHFKDVVESGTKLMRFATVIRSSQSRRRAAKGETHEAYDEAGNPIFKALDDILLSILRRDYPEISEGFLLRLHDAIAKRRRQFAYNREHQARIAYGSTVELPSTNKPQSGSEVKSNEGLVTIPVPELNPERLQALRPMKAKTVWTQTSASSFHGQLQLPAAPSSITSASRRSKKVDLKSLLPLAPLVPGKRFFECPCCCVLLPSEQAQPKAWSKHLLKDLKPYVCVFDSCESTSPVFFTSEDWILHLATEHSSDYCCDGFQHPPETFDSVEAFQGHMRAYHKDDLDEKQLPRLTLRSKIQREVIIDQCPFCDYDPEDKTRLQNLKEENEKIEYLKKVDWQRQDHVQAHLVELFLCALPPDVELQDVPSTGSRTIGTHSSQSLESEIDIRSEDITEEQVEIEDASEEFWSWIPSHFNEKDLLDDPRLETFRQKAEQIPAGIDTIDETQGEDSETSSSSPTTDFMTLADEEQNRRTQECLQLLRPRTILLEQDNVLPSEMYQSETGYDWVLETDAYRQWRQSDKHEVLWLRGQPGIGKTVVALFLSENLRLQSLTQVGHSEHYISMQDATQHNTAVALLRDVLHNMCLHQPILFTETQQELAQELEHATDADSEWRILRNVFKSIIDTDHTATHPSGISFYIILDGIESCSFSLDKLLDFIAEDEVEVQNNLKWIISSRSNSLIQRYLGTKFSIEINSQNMSQALEEFVHSKVQGLKRDERDIETLKAELLADSYNTFWSIEVACLLHSILPRAELAKMISDSSSREEAYYNFAWADVELFSTTENVRKKIILACAFAPSPLEPGQIKLVAELEVSLAEETLIDAINQSCGAFLKLKDGKIYFTHRFAKMWVRTKISSDLQQYDLASTNRDIALRCLRLMAANLGYDMCDIGEPGASVTDTIIRNARRKIEPAMRYACQNWWIHVYRANQANSRNFDDFGRMQPGVQHPEIQEALGKFFRSSFVYWLECLSLLGEDWSGYTGLALLSESVGDDLKPRFETCLKFINDPFVNFEIYPLQISIMAMLSQYRHDFHRLSIGLHRPSWIESLTRFGEPWPPGMPALEEENAQPRPVAISKFKYVAVPSKMFGIDIWHTKTGRRLNYMAQILSPITSLAFSPVDWILACGCEDGSVSLWDEQGYAPLHMLPSNGTEITSMAFSPDGTQLAAGNRDGTVRLWNPSENTIQETVETQLTGEMEMYERQGWDEIAYRGIYEMRFTNDMEWIVASDRRHPLKSSQNLIRMVDTDILQWQSSGNTFVFANSNGAFTIFCVDEDFIRKLVVGRR